MGCGSLWLHLTPLGVEVIQRSLWCTADCQSPGKSQAPQQLILGTGKLSSITWYFLAMLLPTFDFFVWSHGVALAHCPGTCLMGPIKDASRCLTILITSLFKAEILDYLIKCMLSDFLLYWRQDSWAGKTNISQVLFPLKTSRERWTLIMPQLDTLNILIDKLEDINS